ncbi:MAG: hypothetical protein PHP93_03945 [Kiritimatiellales bacterium]|nr:hypothetical protein [Kiritimatiellales bacterium]
MENIISAKLRLSFVAFAALLLGCSAHAATLYWDTNGSTSGAGNPADGIWDTNTTANWSTDASGLAATTVYTDGSDVVFSAGSDAATATVTASGTPVFHSLTFEEGNVTINATLNDDTTTSSITVKNGANASIAGGGFNGAFDIQGNGIFFADAITGGGGMSKEGTGTATFGRLDATLTVNGGTLIYTGLNAAKLKGATVNADAVLRLEGNTFDGTKRNVTVNAGGRLELAAGVDQTISYFQGTGTVAGEGATLRVGGDNKPTTFAGTITGDLDLWAVGTGTFTDNASMEFVISSNGVNNAILGDGTGTIILGGSFNFNLTGADLAVGNSWTLVDVANLNETFGASFSVTGFTESSAGVWTNAEGNLVFSESTGVLSVIPINVMTIMFQTSR